MYFQTRQNKTKKKRLYQLHTLTKGTTEEEKGNKIPKGRIKMQQGVLRI